jgi:hypothetical protein
MTSNTALKRLKERFKEQIDRKYSIEDRDLNKRIDERRKKYYDLAKKEIDDFVISKFDKLRIPLKCEYTRSTENDLCLTYKEKVTFATGEEIEYLDNLKDKTRKDLERLEDWELEALRSICTKEEFPEFEV